MVQAPAPAWSIGFSEDEDEPTPFDRAVERWNWLFPEERAEAVAVCRQEGHPPRLDLGYARVCPRCLRYDVAS